jgi:glucan 1,3-beta-glucosidase
VVLLALLVIATAFAVGRWLQLGVPVPVPEPGASRIDCVSYAPFRRPGDSPFDPLAFIDESRIESDLRALSGRTGCVRTYSVTQGLDAVPRVAVSEALRASLRATVGEEGLRILPVATMSDHDIAAAVGGCDIDHTVPAVALPGPMLPWQYLR